MWINSITKECSSVRPIRVRLEDSSTRTQEAVTDEILTQAGWEYIIDPPAPGNYNDTTI